MTEWLKRRLTGLYYGDLRGQPGRAREASPEVRQARVLPMASHAPRGNGSGFREVYEAVREHTLIDMMRLYERWTLGRQLGDVAGDFLEVGVWRGGSGCLIKVADHGK